MPEAESVVVEVEGCRRPLGHRGVPLTVCTGQGRRIVTHTRRSNQKRSRSASAGGVRAPPDARPVFAVRTLARSARSASRGLQRGSLHRRDDEAAACDGNMKRHLLVGADRPSS